MIDRLLTRAELAEWLSVTRQWLDAIASRPAVRSTRPCHPLRPPSGQGMARPSHVRTTNGTSVMRYQEITEDEPVKPLTPKQSRRRATQQQKAQAKLTNIKATTAIKINAERQKLSEI